MSKNDDKKGAHGVVRVSDEMVRAEIVSGANSRAMSVADWATIVLKAGLRAIAAPKSSPQAVTPEASGAKHAAEVLRLESLLKFRDAAIETHEETIEDLRRQLAEADSRAPALAFVADDRAPPLAPADDAAPDRASLLSSALARLTVSICDEPVGVLAMLDAECDAWNERNAKAPPRDRVTQALALLATAGGRLAAVRKDAAKRAGK